MLIMAKQVFLKEGGTIKVGKEPVVIVPLKSWEGLEDKLEDYEALNSKSFRASVKLARQEIAAGKIVYLP